MQKARMVAYSGAGERRKRVGARKGIGGRYLVIEQVCMSSGGGGGGDGGGGNDGPPPVEVGMFSLRVSVSNRSRAQDLRSEKGSQKQHWH